MRATIFFTATFLLFFGCFCAPVDAWLIGDRLCFQQVANEVQEIVVADNAIYFLTPQVIYPIDRFTHDPQDPVSLADLELTGPLRGGGWSTRWSQLLLVTSQGNFRWSPQFRQGSSQMAGLYDSVAYQLPCPTQWPLLSVPFGYLFSTEGSLQDTHFRHYNIYRCAGDNDGNYWAVLSNLGIGYVPRNSTEMRIVPLGLASPEAGAFAIDRKDRVWIAGSRPLPWTDYPPPPHQSEVQRYPTQEVAQRGITRYDTDYRSMEWINYSDHREFTSEDVACIVAKGDRIWFGTLSGLVLYDMDEDRWAHPPDPLLATRAIYAMLDLDSLLVLGTDDGLYTTRIIAGTGKDKLPILTDTRRIALPQDRRRAVYDLAYRQGRIWVAGEEGIHTLDLPGKPQVWNGWHGVWQPVYALALRGDTTWYGGPWGMAFADRDTGGFFGSPFIGYSGPVTDLVPVGDFVFLAVPDGVIKYRIADRSWFAYVPPKELPISRITRLLPSEDAIWCGGSTGIVRMIWNDPSRGDW